MILNGYKYNEAKYFGHPVFGKRFGTINPAHWQGVLLHSAYLLDDPGRYICESPDRKVSYHFTQRRPNDIFQQNVPLNKRAWHGGYQFNGTFIGVCWAGENDRDRGLFGIGSDMEHFLVLLTALDNWAGKKLKFAMHRHVNLKKRDPRGIANVPDFLRHIGCIDGYYTRRGLIWVRK